MAEHDSGFWSRWQNMAIVFIVIVALVLAGAYASYALLSSPQSGLETVKRAESGDAVSVNYIGMFEDGTVFDTSIMSVAENNTLYPKSLSFEPRVMYSPLNFTIGSGSMIAGFESGVIGMAVNQTKTVIIPPDEGYGQADQALIIERSLTMSIPVYEWMGNSTEFQTLFQISPAVGTNVRNPEYGWNMTVYHIDFQSNMVLLKNNPFMGEVVTVPEGWSAKVISIDTSSDMGAGQIVLKHLLTQTDVNSRLFTDESERQFMITAVDPAAGIYTVDYNGEVLGKTLVFKITLLSITSGS